MNILSNVVDVDLLDDGTLDTVVRITTTCGASLIERFDSETRFGFDADPDTSTDLFLDDIKGQVWDV
tara:strand:- start:281 stop:481 length:201 start_codon:yes stop_codon:yes gene_type:complete